MFITATRSGVSGERITATSVKREAPLCYYGVMSKGAASDTLHTPWVPVTGGDNAVSKRRGMYPGPLSKFS